MDSLKKITLCALLFCSAHFLFGQQNIKLFDFRNSTCEQEVSNKVLRTRIIKKELNAGILTVEIAATATCCVDFSPTIKLNSGVLDLSFEETGDACECFCCYEFVYKINNVNDEKIHITFRGKKIEQSNEKYLTYPISYQVTNGDTTNLTDKYGLRQGLWRFSDGLRIVKFFDSFPIWVAQFYSSGKLEKEVVSERIKLQSWPDSIYMDNKLIQYFESGIKKKECYHPNSPYYQGTCKEWNEQGELIYEGDFKEN